MEVAAVGHGGPIHQQGQAWRNPLAEDQDSDSLDHHHDQHR
jgi:hypothetical protein